MQFLFNGPEGGPVLLLAHGSGAPMDSDFMERFAELGGEAGIRIVRFEFSFMAGRRTTGRKRPPPRAEKLMDEFVAAIDALGSGPVFIGGKSLGGRVASMIADEQFRRGSICGLVCLGYPFHPPGKPDALRTAHLEDLSCPALIIQGENDPFGKRAEVEALSLSPTIEFCWCPSGNHDLKPPKRTGLTAEDNWRMAAGAVFEFMQQQEGK